MESAKVEKYTKLTASAADLLAKKYLDKKCMSQEQMLQQKIVPPTKIMGDPYKEDLKVVLGHLGKLDDELVADDAVQSSPFPFNAAATKYGNYWASLGEMYYKDFKFYQKQGLGAAPSVPRRPNASNVSQGGRRMGLTEDWVTQFVGDYMSDKFVAAKEANIQKTFSFPFTQDCAMDIAYERDEKGMCLEVTSSGKCKPKNAAGWYARGNVKGCIGKAKNNDNINANLCVGYNWGAEKSFKVAGKEYFHLACAITVEGCVSVRGAYHLAWGYSRWWPVKPVYGFTVGLSAAVGKGVDGGKGTCGPVSIDGHFEVEAGPCGAGLDMVAKAGLHFQACVSVAGIFSSCFDLEDIAVTKGEIDLADCR